MSPFPFASLVSHTRSQAQKAKLVPHTRRDPWISTRCQLKGAEMMEVYVYAWEAMRSR